MSERITTKDGDVLDDLIWRHYARTDVLAAVLVANPHLAQLAPLLSAGQTVWLPDLPTPGDTPVVRLWS
jgi:phage tail protein X